MAKVNPQIEESWKSMLACEFRSDYFYELKQFLVEEKKQHAVYPPGDQIFSAFNHTPVGKVKVVILGQDPYHGRGQAHGLCFSVPDGMQPPPSLENIYKELHDDLGIPVPNHGNLTNWAKQGVLLLNATLTVRAANAGSHQDRGWERFTDSAIKILSDQKDGLVFMLWGRYAQNKASLIDGARHLILKAAHPSPFSANNGFFGCRHFSKANEYLKQRGRSIVDWAL